MRILLYHPFIRQRKDPISYRAMQTTSGFSGTETALLEICAHMIQCCGCYVDVVGLCDNGWYIDESSGICFMSCDEFVDRAFYDYDWFSPLFYFDGFSCDTVLRRLDRDKTSVLVWLHCFVSDQIIHSLTSAGFRVKLACVSEWIRGHYMHVMDDTRDVCLVQNGISPLMFRGGDVPKQPGHWCFHAVFERGGEVALRCFDKVRAVFPGSAKTFHLMSYYTDTKVYAKSMEAGRLAVHGSVSKTMVSDILASCEYFVYPLVLPTDSVHHDTFACVILEALALGVIVVTWNVACIPHVYGEYVVGLDPAIEYPKDARFMTHAWFNSDEAVSMLSNAVLNLEMHPEKKMDIRQKGMRWARDVSRQWSSSGDKMFACLQDKKIESEHVRENDVVYGTLYR